MDKGMYTKRKFADAFLELVVQKGIENIKVSELTALTGLSRESFYYHFKDKYDLMAWIYGQQKMSIVAEYMGKESWAVTVARVLRLIREYSHFYRKGFSDQAYYNLEKVMTDFTIQLFEKFVFERKGNIALTEQERFAIQFNAHGAVCMTKMWVGQGMKTPEEEQGILIYSSMPEIIRVYFEKDLTSS